MEPRNLMDRRIDVLQSKAAHFFDDILHLVKGEGMWLWDEKGRKYLDFYNNVASVGHCHPDVVATLADQAGKLNISTRYLHHAIVEFAEALTATLPDHLDTCYFSCTGTEANDLAIQVARVITGNRGVLTGEFCYHGTSTLVMTLSTDSYPAAERPDWLATFEAPDLYRGSYANDPDAAQKYLAQVVEQLDALEARGHRLAAALIDCSFDNIGVVRPPLGFMKGLFDEIRRRGGLLIADEVQAGYCRMGTHFWGFEHHGAEPDIVTCSKPMGDGFPMAVTALRRELSDRYAEKYSYFNTTAGSPVAGAVGKTVLDIFEREGLLARATDTGAYLATRLSDLAQRHTCIGTARGYGMFQGLDLVRRRDTKAPITRKEARHLTTLIAEEGLITGTSGIHGNIIKIRPPLVAERCHVDIAIDALDKALLRFSQEMSSQEEKSLS